jgi:hypothetical protein
MSTEERPAKKMRADCPVDFQSTFFKNSLKSDIRSSLINGKANACPMAVRIAWHASGTYDKNDGSGGSNGATMRFSPEKDDDANAGLSIISDLLKPVKAKNESVSNADIWTLAGGFACEFLGGPKIDVRMGREDKPDGSYCPENGRLPDAAQGAQHLRDVFYRQGFNDQEIVALSGAHTLGRCHKTRSGFDGPWTQNPLNFDNQYFKNLVNMKWTPREWDGPLQFQDESGKYMMLPTDMALMSDEKFRPHVEAYAKDEQLFFTDFAAAFAKLLSNGCPAACAPKEDSPAALAGDASSEFREHCMHGSLEHAIACLKNGADPASLESNSGRTGLMKAAFWGHDHVVAHLLNELKVDLNVQDVDGETALHDAARFGHKGVATLLVDGGADASLQNKKGQTALQVAEEYDQPDIIAILSGKK